MHEKRKKYYHIRKDLFWCTILLAISFLIGYAIHHRIFLTHSLKADAPKERTEITFDDLQSNVKELASSSHLTSVTMMKTEMKYQIKPVQIYFLETPAKSRIPLMEMFPEEWLR